MNTPSSASNGHVLILEDNPDSRSFFTIYLTQEHFTVDAVADADGARRALVARRPDIILLDLNLPGINGFEIARQLHANPQTASIPILVITALTSEIESDPRIKNLPNIRRFFYKPCRPRTLVDAVQSTLNLARMQAAPPPPNSASKSR
jgi:DNA-binding response OmpR family regulator